MLRNALNLLTPAEAGALWIGLLVTFLVFGDFRRIWSSRNLSLAALLALAPLLIHILHWEERRLAFVFGLVFLVTAFYTVWGVVLAYRWPSLEWRAQVPTSSLVALLAALVMLNAGVTFGRPPDDAGYYTNIGAGRWVETGVLPYGDRLLKGPDAPGYGAAATYGPLLYAAHVPFQWLLRTPRNSPDADPRDIENYQRPPVLATKLTCFAFYLVGLFALFKIVRRSSGLAIALGAAAIYAGSPYLVGLGGDEWVITGLRFISHIAPVAAVLLALLWIERPLISGVLLAVGAGLLFYPAFLFPLWVGYYFWQDKGDALRFTAGFAGTGLVILAIVLSMTPAQEGSSSLTLFLESTLEHQEGFRFREYGASEFGFWGTHPELASFWQTPIFGSSSLSKPSFLVFALAALAAFFVARGRSVAQFAGLIAALCAGIQLYKTHAAGSYVEWYFPFLLISLFSQARGEAESEVATSEPSPMG